MVLAALKASGGKAVSASESRLQEWQQRITSSDGIFICPESATCIGVLEQLVADGEIGADERVVVFNTAAGQKYVESNQLDIPQIELNEINWNDIGA